MSPKISDLLEQHKQLEQRAETLRVQLAKLEARRESEKRQYEDLLTQLEAEFHTRDLGEIKEKIDAVKQQVAADLERFAAELTQAEAQVRTAQEALAKLDAA